MSVYYKEYPANLKLAIQSMINQTIPPDEFIIVKDGELTPELDQVIDKYIKEYPNLFTIIINSVNLGLGPSLRKGVIASKNELIARMDSDDYSVPNRCEKQLTCFEMDKELGIVGTVESEFVGNIDNVVAIHSVPEYNEDIIKFMHKRCAVLHPTVIFKRSEVIKSGNYQEKSYYPLYEDYDLFARMIFDNKVKCYNMQESLYFVRISEDFYERRGGLKYANTVIRFKWHMFKKGYMSMIDFIISGFGQALVCILPNKLRKAFYMNILR